VSYWDTSALLKLYVTEEDSPAFLALAAGAQRVLPRRAEGGQTPGLTGHRFFRYEIKVKSILILSCFLLCNLQLCTGEPQEGYDVRLESVAVDGFSREVNHHHENAIKSLSEDVKKQIAGSATFED
jgi:hypothetical protein